jgi:hypothetical protein
MTQSSVQPIKLAIGPHQLTYEPPDTVYWVGVGVLSGDQASTIMDQIVDWGRNQPYLLVVINVMQVSSFSTEARKVLTSNGHRLPPRVLSFFGGSFATHVLLDLMDRASSLLGSKNRVAKHWPDEKSARAWAAEMRPVLLARGGARGGTL